MTEPSSHPFLGHRVELPIETVVYESDFSCHALPLVRDHRIHGMTWTNLVIYLEMAMAAATRLFHEKSFELTEVSVPRGLILPDHGSRRVQLAVAGNSFRVFSWNSAWTLHAQGTIAMTPALDSQPLTSCPTPDGLNEISVLLFYRELEDQGVLLGPSCQGLMRLWIGDGNALAMLKPVSEDARYELPLIWIDSAFQLLTALLPRNAPRDFIFTGLESFQVFGPVETSQPGYCYAIATSTHPEVLTGDLCLFDSTGRMVVLVKNARLERAAPFTAPKKALAYSADPILEELHVALPEEQHNVMVSYLVRVLGQTLRKQPQELDIDIPLIGFLDSLMAVELKTRIETDLRVEVPVAAIFEGDSIAELGRYLLKDTLAVQESVAEMIRDLESLPDSEVEAMLKMERGESDG